jgi:sugar phosphate isomerase/epimerase
MRFGISPMTYDLLIDGILAKKGLKGISKFQFSELVKKAAESGYQHFEIALDLFQVFPIPMNNHQIRILQDIKNEYGITYSAHLPFLSIDLGGPNEFIREGSVNAMIHAYNSIIELEDDIDVFVLHPTGETVASVIKFRKLQRNYSVLMLYRVLKGL